MPTCVKIKRKHRKICIGELEDRIQIYDRSISPGTQDSPRFGENFVQDSEVWAMLETKQGYSIFDSTGTERKIDHIFGINYDASITSEKWVRFESENYDILKVEDLDRRHEFLLLYCNLKGDSSRAANLL